MRVSGERDDDEDEDGPSSPRSYCGWYRPDGPLPAPAFASAEPLPPLPLPLPLPPPPPSDEAEPVSCSELTPSPANRWLPEPALIIDGEAVGAGGSAIGRKALGPPCADEEDAEEDDEDDEEADEAPVE
jgi:hypothetical protein